MKPINTDWTPTLTAKLRVLFDQGLSFSHIASELAMSRNAVVGRCHRLGLRRLTIPEIRAKSAKEAHLVKKMRPMWDPRRNSRAQKIQAGPKINLDVLPPTPPSDLDIPKRRRKNIRTLGPRDCRYIVGDPATPEHFYCGARKLPTLPYCADHARRCYHPAKGG